ncbi:NAC domain-containing protein [Psidium guajava]|nr:NAC domain-containing protein [Psidium guajava]
MVKKADGLGVWYWLVLPNGIEVKLRRNAPSVIEALTGNEEDDVRGQSHDDEVGRRSCRRC